MEFWAREYKKDLMQFLNKVERMLTGLVLCEFTKFSYD